MDELRVTQVNDIFYLDQFDGKAHIRGTLHLTLTHVFFLGSSRKQELWVRNNLISDVEKLPLTTGGAPMIIQCKNFRIIHFLFPWERDCHEVFTTIKKLKVFTSITELPCFTLVPSGCRWDRSDGWSSFGLRSQLERFGIPSRWWSLSDVNKDYNICSTYPTILCLPTAVTRSMIQASSRFRSRGRVPVLTYLHPQTKAALCRSSQPLAGFASKCVEDQLLLEAIRLASPSPSATLYVVDTRPALNALTNRAQGKGYEDVTVYRNVVIQFFDIENIHVVRSSLAKLLRVIQNPALTVEAFVSGVDQSGWLRHMRSILEAAYFVAGRLSDGSSVLVHCSDGWDRTTQVCSLAQIILDPYYRTFSGLEALIKKEWLQFGHKFTDRCGLLHPADTRELSPILTQFLDCVRHLCELCPTEFEYNCDLLCWLHDSAYSAEFGTFVGCSEYERDQLGVRTATYSLWPMIRRNLERFTNPYYKHKQSPSYSSDAVDSDHMAVSAIPHAVDLSDGQSVPPRAVVEPLPSFVLAPQLFKLWRGLFLRWEWRLPKPERLIAGAITDLTSGLLTLDSHGRLLEARITQLCSLLKKPVESVLPSRPTVASTDSSSHETLSDLPSDSKTSLNADVSECQQDSSLTNGLSNQECINGAPLVSLPPLSVKQLMSELDSVSVRWTHLARQDVPCANCTASLALADHPVHCHQCGHGVCWKCLNLKPRSLPGLWYPQLHNVWICGNCAAVLDKKLSMTSKSL